MSNLKVPVIDNATELINWETELSQCIVTSKSKIKNDVWAIGIIQGGVKYRFMTYGGLSVIGGRSGSKKTTLMSMIMGAAESRLPILKTFIGYTPGKTNIIIDTEQTKYDIQGMIKRINNLTEKPTEDLIAYSLEPYDANERIEAVEYIMNKHDNIGLVMMDGIRDLQPDINNSEQTHHTMTRIQKWKNKHNCHMCFALHTNKGQFKHDLRGHLGTELSNKAELVLITEENPQAKWESRAILDKIRGGRKFQDIYYGYGTGGSLYINSVEEDMQPNEAKLEF